jgi:hypothetical protein
MLDWLQYRKELIGRIDEFGALSLDTLTEYQTLSKAGRKTAKLDCQNP